MPARWRFARHAAATIAAMTTFDTLTYAKKLRAAGFTEQQAEAQAEGLREAVGAQLATKSDLKEVEAALRHDLKELESALRHDLKELESALRHEIELVRREVKEVELRLTVRLGVMMGIAIGIVAALVKLL